MKIPLLIQTKNYNLPCGIFPLITPPLYDDDYATRSVFKMLRFDEVISTMNGELVSSFFNLVVKIKDDSTLVEAVRKHTSSWTATKKTEYLVRQYKKTWDLFCNYQRYFKPNQGVTHQDMIGFVFGDFGFSYLKTQEWIRAYRRLCMIYMLLIANSIPTDKHEKEIVTVKLPNEETTISKNPPNEIVFNGSVYSLVTTTTTTSTNSE